MADTDRTSSHPVTLLEQLAHEPYAFDFFQAVRRMDCEHPDKPQTGESVRLIDDLFVSARSRHWLLLRPRSTRCRLANPDRRG